MNNDKNKLLQNQKIIKRCFDIYQGTWIKNEISTEAEYLKLLNDFYQKEEEIKNDEKIYQNSYLNQLRKCKKIKIFDFIYFLIAKTLLFFTAIKTCKLTKIEIVKLNMDEFIKIEKEYHETIAELYKYLL